MDPLREPAFVFLPRGRSSRPQTTNRCASPVGNSRSGRVGRSVAACSSTDGGQLVIRSAMLQSGLVHRAIAAISRWCYKMQPEWETGWKNFSYYDKHSQQDTMGLGSNVDRGRSSLGGGNNVRLESPLCLSHDQFESS